MATFLGSDIKEPLIERQTKEAIARRSGETVGIILIIFAGLAAAMLGSFSADDPSLFNATDTETRNLLGRPGAFVADLMHRAVGWAAWGVPLFALVWGLRFIIHKGEGRIIGRAIIAPFAIGLTAVLAAAHAPLEGWLHSYGLGGWFGDAVLGGLLSLVPMSMDISLKMVTLALAAGSAVLALIALGATMREMRTLISMCRAGVWMLGRAILRGLGYLGIGSLKGAKAIYASAATRPDDTASAPTSQPSRVRRAEPPVMSDQDDAAIMARISEAVAKRGRTDTDVVPELGGVTRDADMPDRLMDLPRAEAVPEQKEQVVKPAAPKKLRKSSKARAEEQPRLALGDASNEPYQTPPLSLLSDPSTIVRSVLSNDALEENARMLENVLDDYGVKGEIVSVRPGPVVTMYELEPAPGLKASRVIGLSDDIARSMSALAARVSTIPGRNVIGIELPNDHREMVLLREILSASAYGDSKMKLPLALGKDISGEPVVANLAKMPHLLIAGTTGSGKSVAINTMILSLLYQLSPDECRLIMIDPKMLELSVYDGIPHLLSPVVTDPKKAVQALKWVVGEMEERYRKMSKLGVRNIDGYNGRVRDALKAGEAFSRQVQTGFDEATGEPIFEIEEFTPETMPYIVVIVDEMADLMMVAGKEIEACIQRLAQMARASGIHLIMATQRPSVDVITGTIKANFPTRISFQVTSKVDSRTILGEMGAEQLLGMGDMLYMAGGGRVTRVHGPFASDEEVEEIVAHLKSYGAPEYVQGVQDGPEDGKSSDIDMVLGLGGNTTGEDALYDQAVAIVAHDRKCSTSYIQRKLSIGYNKAAKLVEQMEDEGVVSQANHVGKREVLVPER
jgi:S-DNA-T family DNA segregation ATPase FtsK/SpoIIIE